MDKIPCSENQYKKHRTTFIKHEGSSLGTKLKSLLQEDKFNSSNQVKHIMTDNLLSSRSARPKTKLERVLEYLSDILAEFEKNENEEFVIKTEWVIKEIKANKMYKYEEQGDPMQNKLLSLYSPDFDRDKAEEDSENEKGSFGILEDINDDQIDYDEDSTKAIDKKIYADFDEEKDSKSKEFSFSEKAKKSQPQSRKSMKILKFEEEAEKVNERKEGKEDGVSNNKALKLDEKNDNRSKSVANIIKADVTDNQETKNELVKSTDKKNEDCSNNNKKDLLRLSSNNPNKNYKKSVTTVISNKLIKPIDIKQFGVNFDVFSYASEVGRIFLLKQVSIAAFSYKEVYTILKTSYFDNYIEELRAGYTKEPFAYYHNVKNNKS